ncbi:MAG: hypothetical protein ACREOO_28805 [bacterium]
MFDALNAYRIVGMDRVTKPAVEQVRQRVHPEDVVVVEKSFARAARIDAGIEDQNTEDQ